MSYIKIDEQDASLPAQAGDQPQALQGRFQPLPRRGRAGGQPAAGPPEAISTAAAPRPRRRATGRRPSRGDFNCYYSAILPNIKQHNISYVVLDIGKGSRCGCARWCAPTHCRPTRNLQPATCNLQPATCNLQPATCNLQPATCNLQPATFIASRLLPDSSRL